MAFLAGVGVLFILLLICYFIWGWPFATPEGPEETNPAPGPGSSGDPPGARVEIPPPASVPGGASATLEAELTGVLVKLEEANRKQDLQQLLSLYSPSFPDSPRKAREISRSGPPMTISVSISN